MPALPTGPVHPSVTVNPPGPVHPSGAVYSPGPGPVHPSGPAHPPGPVHPSDHAQDINQVHEDQVVAPREEDRPAEEDNNNDENNDDLHDEDNSNTIESDWSDWDPSLEETQQAQAPVKAPAPAMPSLSTMRKRKRVRVGHDEEETQSFPLPKRKRKCDDAPIAPNAGPVTAHRGDVSCPPPTPNLPLEGEKQNTTLPDTNVNVNAHNLNLNVIVRSDLISSKECENQPISNNADLVLSNLLENCSLRD